VSEADDSLVGALSDYVSLPIRTDLGEWLMVVRNVDLSPTCCCLDCPVDGIVVVCTAVQNDGSDKYIVLDEADQYDQCILSNVDQ